MNALIDFFIDRYKATLTFLALIIVWGLSSVALIPASAYSDINIPYVFVSTGYEGASPEDVERLITRPLEDRFRSLSEVKSMQSWSRDGMGYLILEFPDRYPKEDALVDVKDAIDEILPDLPEESEKPFVKEFSFDAFPVMNLNFISDIIPSETFNLTIPFSEILSGPLILAREYPSLSYRFFKISILFCNSLRLIVVP